MKKQYRVGTILRSVKDGYVVKVVSWDEYEHHTHLNNKTHLGFAHIIVSQPEYPETNGTYGWDEYDTEFVIVGGPSFQNKYDELERLLNESLIS
jgi:hypothetical protein